MANRDQMERVVRELYAARSASDIDGTLKDFAEDGVFMLNGRGLPVENAGAPVIGKAAVRAAVADLIRSWKFEDWKVVSFLADGDKAALHWRANVTNSNSGKRAPMDCFDFITFRGGKIANFHQSADTALMMQLAM